MHTKHKGIIFDFDGVIADTQKYHAQVESRVLSRLNIHIPPHEITKQYAGVTDKDFFESITHSYGIKNIEVNTLIKDKWETMAIVLKSKLRLIRGVKKLIQDLYDAQYKLAIASSSHLSFLISTLNDLAVSDYFQNVTSAEEVKKGKPAPDVFLLAAARLKIPPSRCIVIEDGRSGIIAAKAAGMKTVGYDPFSDGHLKSDITIQNFNSLTTKTIATLFS